MPAHQIQTDAVQFSWYPLVFYPVEEKNKQTNKQTNNNKKSHQWKFFLLLRFRIKRLQEIQTILIIRAIKARVGEEISSMRMHKRWRYLHYRASNFWLVGAKIRTNWKRRSQKTTVKLTGNVYWFFQTIFRSAGHNNLLQVYRCTYPHQSELVDRTIPLMKRILPLIWNPNCSARSVYY